MGNTSTQLGQALRVQADLVRQLGSIAGQVQVAGLTEGELASEGVGEDYQRQVRLLGQRLPGMVVKPDALGQDARQMQIAGKALAQSGVVEVEDPAFGVEQILTACANQLPSAA